MALQPVEKIWMDGEFVDWQNAQVHVLTHALHYGTGVLEGIRFYDTDDGVAIFRLTDHMRRLAESAKIMLMELPYSTEELVEVTKELIRVNGVRGGYIRPLAFRGYEEMGLNPLTCPVNVTIAVWPWGNYLGDDSITKGIRLHVSSWQRISSNALPPAAKSTANYMNSALAKVEANRAGYDDAVFLNERGLVAESSGMNIFIVKNGELVTPPTASGGLAGFRRASVIQVARDLGITVREGDLVRSDLYLADEMFVTGTAAEVAAVNSVDARDVGSGKPGPVTKKIHDVMHDAVRGKVAAYKHWVEYV
jgi:branched-chain amino acid aminotransferase